MSRPSHNRRGLLVAGWFRLIATVALFSLLALSWPTAIQADPGQENKANRYVALGDSYVAGPKIPQQDTSGCARSDHNYPSIAAATVDVPLTDVSCSGATTKHLWEAQRDKSGKQINAPQLDALTPQTKVVTLGIGGNDIGFSDIVTTCVGAGTGDPSGNPCQQHYTAGGTDRLADAISATAPQVANVLDEITKRAPAAKVYVVGYPTILPAQGQGCFSAMPLAAGDLPYLHNTVIGGLNTMLKNTAAQHSATYVDTATPTLGHDVCQPANVRYVEGLNPASPAAPVHPNGAGMAAVGDVVGAALGITAPGPEPKPTPKIAEKAAGAGGSAGLPRTGTAVAWILGLGAVLVIGGVALSILTRRRRSSD